MDKYTIESKTKLEIIITSLGKQYIYIYILIFQKIMGIKRISINTKKQNHTILQIEIGCTEAMDVGYHESS